MRPVDLPVLGTPHPGAGAGSTVPGGAEGGDEVPRPRTREERVVDLHERLRRCAEGGMLVAFSGGVDSAFLLWAARRAANEAGGRVAALTTVSASVPDADRDDARRFSEGLGVEHLWVRTRELESEAYARNDHERCYHCKAELFDVAGRMAADRGLAWILYGYTASDRGDDRPGHRAARERGVRSPLAESGITKADIRATMRARGLELSEKPASPCLSSRIMTGVRVTAERLAHVQEMESILRDAGVRVCRVRVCRGEGTAGRGGFDFLRIEVDPAEMPRVVEVHRELSRRARTLGYRWATLDLAGYRTGGGTG